MASGRNGTLYIGVTSDLVRRVTEHKLGLIDGFTKRYSVNKLVYYDLFDSIVEAIAEEKRLKHWNRRWKIRLIEVTNPEWNDLSGELGI